MRPVLGFQVELTPDSASPLESAAWLRERLQEWVRGWYERRGAPLAGGTESGTYLGVPSGHHLSQVQDSPSDSESLLELTWQYPADGDPSALWTSRATIAVDDSGADLSLGLSIASVEFMARPFRFDLWVPRIIREIARSNRGSLGGRPFVGVPRSVSVGSLASFVEQDLLSATRRLPIVLIAQVISTGRFPVDPFKLANDLCGLAEVWVLNDRWTSYSLSDALGARLSCFDGALRTYWSGFRRSDDPFAHPLITSKRLEELEGQAVDIGRFLVRHLAPVGALRLTDSARATRVRATVADHRRAAALADVQRSLAQGEVAKLEEQLLEAWEATDHLRRQLKDATDRADTAEQELSTVRENFALVAAAVRSSDAQAEGGDGDDEVAIESVAAAVTRAQVDFSVLHVWSSARKSATESRFARPDLVYRALEAIAEVATLRGQQRQTRAPLGNLEDLFQERGFQYSPFDSQTTITKYGRDRTFSEGGRRQRFERHLTLGGGDRQNCVQIYFEFDADSDRVVIGYCGVHLPYDGMR